MSWASDDTLSVALPQALVRSAVSVRQLSDASRILRGLGSGTGQATDVWLRNHLGTINVEFELESTQAIKRLALGRAPGPPACCGTRQRSRLCSWSPISRRLLATLLGRENSRASATWAFITYFKL